MATLIYTVFINNFFFAEANSLISKFLALFILLKVRVSLYLAKALSLGLRLTANMIGSVGFIPLIFFIVYIINIFEIFPISFKDISSSEGFLLSNIIPIKVYSNADTMKQDIIKDNNKKIGIYR